jgi:hypothetical protein
MHRSGTSCLAGSLQQHGVYLGPVFEQNPFNKKGNRENADIMRLNDDVLKANDGSWDQPPSRLDWSSEHAKVRDEIMKSFLESGNRVWGFKDPRTLLTFKFWMDGLTHVDVKFVGSYRNPLPVVKSLQARGSMSIENGLSLWESYNTRLINLCNLYNFPVVSFDIGLEEYQRAIRWILGALGIESNSNIEQVFFDESLRHEQVEAVDNLEELPATIKELYRKLNNIYEGQRV